MQDLDPTQYSEADRLAVHPPVEVQVATWPPRPRAPLSCWSSSSYPGQ